MFKKLFSRKQPKVATPTVLHARQHAMTHRDISRGSIVIIEELEKAGFQAYVVGGGVRDALVGGHPKDFDIATDATPEQIKRLFRSARIIGRRFRIVHVRVGREVLEVTTFRAHHADGDTDQGASSEQGILLRDNVYGDLTSDALRRDFTMNALYYSPTAETITDFTTGVKDIGQRQVRMIGDPATRYQEDPVRMLRAVRLAAKLQFTIEPATAKPIRQLGHLLGHVSPARLFDESLKLFMNGHAGATLPLLREFHLFGQLFPGAEEVLQTQDPIAEALMSLGCANTDARVQNDQRVTPAFIYAVLLWPAVVARQQRLLADGLPPLPALDQAIHWVLSRQVQRVAIPKRFSLVMRDIWELQSRLAKRNGSHAFKVLAHPKFRAGYDFLLLREAAGENLEGLGAWWTEFQAASETEQTAMVAQLQQGPKGKSRTRRRRPKRTKQPDVH